MIDLLRVIFGALVASLLDELEDLTGWPRYGSS